MPRKKKVVEKKPEPEQTEDEGLIEVLENEEIDFSKIDEGPSIHDPNWTSHVLDQLSEDESYEGNPKADGLRRLVETLIGPIISIETHVLKTPDVNSTTGELESKVNVATVKSRISIINQRNNSVKEVYEAVADASNATCVHPFNKYLSSIAETRAEARVFRKILRLKNVVSADELGNVQDQVDENRIQGFQITMIDKMCSEHDISVVAVMKAGSGKELNSINSYTRDDGIAILGKLNQVDNGDKEVPDLIKGYDANWKSNF